MADMGRISRLSWIHGFLFVLLQLTFRFVFYCTQTYTCTCFIAVVFDCILRKFGEFSCVKVNKVQIYPVHNNIMLQRERAIKKLNLSFFGLPNGSLLICVFNHA